MTITFISGNLFDSKCRILTNTINCVGAMGKGIALEFKRRYPDMFADYVLRCKVRSVRTGEPYLYNDDNLSIGILNFPTKYHWNRFSQLEWIVEGLDYFVDHHKGWGIRSIAFPALGCSNGGLSWSKVKPIMIEKLGSLDIEIEIYEPVQ